MFVFPPWSARGGGWAQPRSTVSRGLSGSPGKEAVCRMRCDCIASFGCCLLFDGMAGWGWGGAARDVWDALRGGRPSHAETVRGQERFWFCGQPGQNRWKYFFGTFQQSARRFFRDWSLPRHPSQELEGVGFWTTPTVHLKILRLPIHPWALPLATVGADAPGTSRGRWGPAGTPRKG